MISTARLLTYLVWLGTTILWGTTWVVIRIGLQDLSPLAFAAARTTLAALVIFLVAHFLARADRPQSHEIRFWMLIGVLQLGFPYALIFWAEQSISAGLTATLFATFPAFTVVIAHLLLDDEPMSWIKMGGAMLAFCGVAVLVGPDRGTNPPSIWPVLAVMTAAASGAFAAVVVRRHGRETSTLWLTTIQISSAALFLILLMALLEPQIQVHVTPRAIWSVVYLGIVVTIGCYLGVFWLLKRMDVTLVSMSVGGEAVISVFLGASLLGESLGMRAIVGLALVVLSVVLVSLQSKLSFGPSA